MATMIQVRHVPDEVHRQLKVRAATVGMSMSDYVLAELRRSLARPAREELLRRLAQLPSVELDPAPAAILRAERDRR